MNGIYLIEKNEKFHLFFLFKNKICNFFKNDFIFGLCNYFLIINSAR